MVMIPLFGRILPAESNFTVPGVLSFQWIWQERNMTLDFRIAIQQSNISVECTMPDFDPSDAVELHRRALDLSLAIVGLNAYRLALGLYVVIDRYVLPNGQLQIILPTDPSLKPLATSVQTDADFTAIFPLVCTDATFVHLLNDLIEAITIPHVAVINCARVTEGLRHLVADPASDDKAAWREMQDTLNLDESFLKSITDPSKQARHGRGVHIPGSITKQLTERSWIVMNRFLEYRRRGNQKLPVADFPVLMG